MSKEGFFCYEEVGISKIDPINIDGINIHPMELLNPEKNGWNIIYDDFYEDDDTSFQILIVEKNDIFIKYYYYQSGYICDIERVYFVKKDET